MMLQLQKKLLTIDWNKIYLRYFIWIFGKILLNYILMSFWKWFSLFSQNKENFKQFKFVFFFNLLLLFGAYSFTSMAEDICDCEQLRTTGDCNPNCVKICAFQIPLNEISASVVEKCLSQEKWFHDIIKKESISLLKANSLKREAERKITEHHLKGQELLKKNCPNCDLVPKILSVFKAKPRKKNCPEQYLKPHFFEVVKKVDIEKGSCNKKKIIGHFEKYIKDKLLGKGADSKKLWASCPDPCSFQFNHSIVIDEEACEGTLNLRVDCSHRVDRTFLGIPIYDVDISYTGDLKCMGK